MARQCVAQALEIGVELVAFMPVMYGLPVAALLLVDQGTLDWDVMATQLLAELQLCMARRSTRVVHAPIR